MNLTLNPIALGIYSCFLFSTYVVAQPTNPYYPNGANGSSNFVSGTQVPLIGGSSYGAAGAASGTSDPINGGDSEPVSGNPVVVRNSTITGTVGLDGSIGDGVSGSGGFGGASVFGGISVGGRGVLGAGGNAGDAANNSITITNVTLTGAAGGAGSKTRASSLGQGGFGGASVFGGLSIGGGGGGNSQRGADGGRGGNANGNTVILDTVVLGGALANGGDAGSNGIEGVGSGSSGGYGGGSVFGGVSMGGGGGVPYGNDAHAIGGNAGNASNNLININAATLTGAAGGSGGSLGGGQGGPGGFGGASVYGGLSVGGGGGIGLYNMSGGDAGDASNNRISITRSSLTGAKGGSGGDGGGAGGLGGFGGSSVFGGISIGGGGGTSEGQSRASGGRAGATSGNSITLDTVTLDGTLANGGIGGNAGVTSAGGHGGAGGSGGFGGGSVFGGLSLGGGGGGSSINTNGGGSSDSSNNLISLKNVELIRGLAGQGGNSPYGAQGVAGLDGGSVFGGVSYGGAGGDGSTANGGNAGNTSNNRITIAGDSTISGNVYGGYSQGGAPGNSLSNFGLGGYASNNTITLIGDEIEIKGSLYGGRSINGNGIDNQDPSYNSFYSGNTLKIQSGHFLLEGSIKNFQYYNWLLPENELNGGIIITVDPTKGVPVDLTNTIHSVDVQAVGNVLEAGDQVILITKVTGQPTLKADSRLYIEQGFFIVYDAEMVVQPVSGVDALVLNVLGVTGGGPDGSIHPESEEFLKGRIAQLAMIDQGADMISDGISYARASLRKDNANLFAIVDGGSSKYKNGGVSTLKLNDFKFALGAAKVIELSSQSVGMVAAFAEHGNGNYSSYNNFHYFGDTRGSGKVQYSGVGLMGHLDVAGTDISKVKNKPNIFDDKYGLYLDAAVRVGNVKVDFHSSDIENGSGVPGSYSTKSRYSSAMVGAGYVWTLDEKSAMDFYSRFTVSHMNGKDIQVVDEQMNAGSAHSKRLRLGARYGYIYSATTTPYAGLAFERNFTGDVSGSAYGFTIKETSLKGNTEILEAGVLIKPKGANDPFSLRLGVQGYFGQRKGATAGVRARYIF